MLNKHFREFIELLEKNEVNYLIVGGYAVGVHGFPRYTGDLDIFVALQTKNASKILKTLSDFGFSDLDLQEKDFLETDMVVEIGREPIKIQILTGIDGVTFEECFAEKKDFMINGLNIPFIGIKSLLKNKKASPRAKDRIDFDELLKRNKN
jgi:hypothetical protein